MARRRPRYAGTHPRRFEQRYKEFAAAAYPEHTEHLRAKGRTLAGSHLPVMLQETLQHLAPRPGEVFIDCTLGYGGHARAILQRIAPGGRLIGLDVDGQELAKTQARLSEFGPALLVAHMRFAGIAKALALAGVAQADGILADLGVSSMQLDDPRRGFSLKHDGPLDLRMDDRLVRTAADCVNTLPEEELAQVLRDHADEPDAPRIAAQITAARARKQLTRTHELVELVLRAKGLAPAGGRASSATRGRAVHPAAQTFQALRILVNDEFGNLEALLRMAPSLLSLHGRIVILSFHSGEDRRVKQAFEQGFQAGLYAEIAATPERPTAEEVQGNPRATAARLRFALRS